MKSINYFAAITIGFAVTVSACGSKSNSGQTDETTGTPPAAIGWVDVISKDGKFEAKMPGQPEKSNMVEQTEVGPILIETYMYEESATKVYIIGYNDYPSALMDGATEDDLRQMLDDAINGATSSMGINIIEEKKTLDMDGTPGLMVKGRSSVNSFHTHYKAYLRGNRLYQVGILRDGSYPVDEKSDIFFGNFKLVK
jgi:predicted RNase H-like HicB family nuclease